MEAFKQVMVVKPNAISKEDKETLTAQDIIVVEAANPDDVKLLTFYDGVKGDDFIMSLISGVDLNSYSKEKFVNELFKRLKA